MEVPNWKDVVNASERIRPMVHRTPVFTSSSLNYIAGCKLFFKCENFQRSGAFKFRGATNAVLSLNKRDACRGVATHSSGNHAAALSLVARERGIRAFIVMPETAPEIKKISVAGYGGNIVFCQPTLQAREEALEKVVRQTGAIFIHPYNNYNVVAGQGTAARELMEDAGDIDIVMTPVGGGGLLSGTSVWVKHISPKVKVIAAEPANADDAYRSFKSGVLVPSERPDTIADGLLTSLGELTFKIIMKNVDDIIRVTEESIIESMRLIWQRMKIIVEPSSALPFAAILENPGYFKNQKVAVILTGGNVDIENLPFSGTFLH